MPYFLDSNVILGFVFRCGDRLGGRACAVVEDAEENHSGYVVRCECFGTGKKPGRADVIMEEISDELLRAGAGIRKFGAVGFRSRFEVRKFPRTGLVLQRFFNEGRISDDSVLSRGFPNFEGDYLRRRRQILDDGLVMWHDRRVEVYAGEREVLRARIQNWSDVEVLLDAQDVGLGVGGVVFVTDDAKDIAGKRDVICGCLAGVAEVRRV